MFVGNFEKNPLEAPRSCFVDCVTQNFFSPLQGTNTKTKHYLPSYIFGSISSSHSGAFEALRDNKTAFLTPQRYDKHHCPLNMGVPTPRDCTVCFPLTVTKGEKGRGLGQEGIVARCMCNIYKIQTLFNHTVLYYICVCRGSCSLDPQRKCSLQMVYWKYC